VPRVDERDDGVEAQLRLRSSSTKNDWMTGDGSATPVVSIRMASNFSGRRQEVVEGLDQVPADAAADASLFMTMRSPRSP